MDLPLVLAGPIVRRVADDAVSVWVALRESKPVELAVWREPQISTGPGAVDSGADRIATGTATPRAVGKKLFVSVVTAKADPLPFVPGAVYSYDLLIDGVGLRDLGLLKDEQASPRLAGVHPDAPRHLALGYELDRLPTFVTVPPTIGELCLAHASCRRTNAPGPDALAYLDDIIKAHRADVAKRPQQLFLTGDQIYADDLAGCLLPQLNEIGRELLGFTETLPVEARDVPVDIEQFPALRRKRTVREIGRFTTTDGENHLLSLGEFLAMYLLVWSPRVWQPLAGADAVFTASPHVEANHLFDWESVEGSLADWREKHEKAYGTNVERVQVFAAAVPRVARVLANCATYMMFDDHEVTDDWMISASWRDRVINAPFGHDVLQNGYIAFTVMQMWGNDPAAFTHATGGQAPKNEVLLDTIEKIGTTAALAPATRAALDPLLATGQELKDPEATFHFSVPGPRHLVRVLDTRTRRRFIGRHGPPKLVGDSLDGQLPAGPLTDGREVLFVVSPVPVLSSRLFDNFAQPLSAVVKDLWANRKGKAKGDAAGPPSTGTEKMDIEGWGADEATLESMIQRLAGYPQAVVLSGDVHFSTSMRLDFWNAQATTQTANVVQLTCSPCRNAWPADIQAILRGGRFAQQLIAGIPYERIAWKEKAPIVVPQGTAITPGRRTRMRRAPSLLPAQGWPAGITVPADKPPDWRWRLTMLSDGRPRDQFPRPERLAPPLPRFTPASRADSYGRVAAAHAELALSDRELLRTSVFLPTVGIVRIEEAAGQRTVVHELWSIDSPGSVQGAPATIHRARLSPDPAIERPQLKVVPDA